MSRRPLGCLFEVLETLLLTLLLFLVVQLFVAQPYQIKQQSMENTLMPNQYVLVDKLTPRFDDYHRGDIVIFTPPAAVADTIGTPYIKRVIGIAGDTIDIHNGHVFVNAVELDEPYLFNGQPTLPSDPKNHAWTIKPGQVFVMGDHRADSQDSRVFGPIDKSSIIGRAWLRYWPFEDFGVLRAPDSGASPADTAAPSAIPSPTK